MNILRPTLVPGLSRAWRGAHTLALGHDPALAVLVELADPRTAGLLDRLDGTRSQRLALAETTADGVALGDARELLKTLHAAGLVLPAAQLLPPTLTEAARQRVLSEAAALALTEAAERRAMHARAATHDGPKAAAIDAPPSPAHLLRRRAAAQVEILGRGRLGPGIAVALAEAGIRHIHAPLLGAVRATELPGGPLGPADLGDARAEATARAVTRAAPETKTHPVRHVATVAVQLSYDQPTALVASRHAQRRQPYLPVVIREGTVLVGPYVPATGGPCVHCVELHRRDRDADWAEPLTAADAYGIEPCAVSTVLAATAYVVAEVLAAVDGRTPDTRGAAVEISRAGRFRRRTWSVHPDCDCTRRRARKPGPARPDD